MAHRRQTRDWFCPAETLPGPCDRFTAVAVRMVTTEETIERWVWLRRCYDLLVNSFFAQVATESVGGAGARGRGPPPTCKHSCYYGRLVRGWSMFLSPSLVIVAVGRAHATKTDVNNVVCCRPTCCTTSKERLAARTGRWLLSFWLSCVFLPFWFGCFVGLFC